MKYKVFFVLFILAISVLFSGCVENNYHMVYIVSVNHNANGDCIAIKSNGFDQYPVYVENSQCDRLKQNSNNWIMYSDTGGDKIVDVLVNTT